MTKKICVKRGAHQKKLMMERLCQMVVIKRKSGSKYTACVEDTVTKRTYKLRYGHGNFKKIHEAGFCLKGTLTRDFQPPVFSLKLHPLGP